MFIREYGGLASHTSLFAGERRLMRGLKEDARNLDLKKSIVWGSNRSIVLGPLFTAHLAYAQASSSELSPISD